jgi:hypothetical protein
MTLGRALLPAVLLLSGVACASRRPPAWQPAPPARPVPVPATAALPRIGFSIQVGAFSDPSNAVRLKETLDAHGLEAFHFVGADGLNRVRFGNYEIREEAVGQAEALRMDGVIDDYYVIPPEWSAGATLRAHIVRSALSFLGSPYRWGGHSTEAGFDCSGLTTAAYRLNGLVLPRTAREQHAGGVAVSPPDLREGDLVFFAMDSKRKPTHVGLYLGDGRFIHAPGSGKVVRIDDLAASYYTRRYLGARSYLE